MTIVGNSSPWSGLDITIIPIQYFMQIRIGEFIWANQLTSNMNAAGENTDDNSNMVLVLTRSMTLP